MKVSIFHPVINFDVVLAIPQYSESLIKYTGLEDDITVQDIRKDLMKEEVRTLFRGN